jgi:hypothetical protein
MAIIQGNNNKNTGEDAVKSEPLYIASGNAN